MHDLGVIGDSYVDLCNNRTINDELCGLKKKSVRTKLYFARTEQNFKDMI